MPPYVPSYPRRRDTRIDLAIYKWRAKKWQLPTHLFFIQKNRSRFFSFTKRGYDYYRDNRRYS